MYKYTVNILARELHAIGTSSWYTVTFNDSVYSVNVRDLEGFISLYDRYEHILEIRVVSIEG